MYIELTKLTKIYVEPHTKIFVMFTKAIVCITATFAWLLKQKNNFTKWEDTKVVTARLDFQTTTETKKRQK